MKPKNARGPAKMRFKDLADVHARRNAERIEHDLYGRAIRQVRHIFFRKNASDDALVSMPAGHLIADRKLTLHRDEDLHHLDHAWRQFVSLLQLRDLFVVN